MPQVSAGVLRSTPSSTSASASIRRAAALSFSPLGALRSSEAVRSSRVIDTAAPIDVAPLKGQHRVRVSLIWESPMSHSFGPLVLDHCEIKVDHQRRKQASTARSIGTGRQPRNIFPNRCRATYRMSLVGRTRKGRAIPGESALTPMNRHRPHLSACLKGTTSDESVRQRGIDQYQPIEERRLLHE